MTQEDNRFLRACRGQPVDCTPVWFMRQAGRYMADYRKLRRDHTLLEICTDPELAKAVTLQPIRRFELDAAIIFADILLPLKSMGVEFEFVKGEGPVIGNPVRGPAEVARLHEGDPETDLPYVFEAIRLVRDELDPRVALIGFAGGPFTVASYMIEGGYSRHFTRTKLLMFDHPEAWQRLMQVVTQITVRYLRAQIEAGAQTIQLFDSWVGCLRPEDYRQRVLPYSRALFEGLRGSGVPLIHFGTGTGALLELMKEAGGTVMGVDWRLDLREVRCRLGRTMAIQGNLDPVALLGQAGQLEQQVEVVLEQARGHPGHIFNLGHGILPQTPEENVEAVVRWVHDKSRR